MSVQPVNAPFSGAPTTDDPAPLSMKQMRGRWKVYAGDIAWPTAGLLLAILIGEAGMWAAVVTGTVAVGWAVLPATLLAYASFTVMHEASHGNIAGKSKGATRAETAMGWVSAVPLLAPYPVFKLLHLKHHSHTNHPEKDPDFWVVSSSKLGVIARCWSIIPKFYFDFVCGEAGRSKSGRAMRPQVLAGIVVMLGALGGLIALGLVTEALLLWVVPAWLASGLLALAFDWLPHHPHSAQGRFRDTRILLIPGVTLALLWQNYHLIHHLYPRIPFYRYGRCFRDIRPLLEAEGAPIGGFSERAAD